MSRAYATDGHTNKKNWEAQGNPAVSQECETFPVNSVTRILEDERLGPGTQFQGKQVTTYALVQRKTP